MKKYTGKMIIDYIRGNDIEGIDIEELEDDFHFMRKVILYSNDKNMFQLCSSRLQKDFEFIKFIIFQFQRDLDFVDRIAKSYLQQLPPEEDKTRYELAIIMCKIANPQNKEQFMEYFIMANIALLHEQALVEECKKNCPNVSVGLGFLFIENDDANSEIMLEYYAEKLIDTIPPIRDNQLEKIFHQKWHRKEDIPLDKINSILISFISGYDISLANFLKVHPHILDKLKEEIKIILENWDSFDKREERKLFLILFEQVHQYIENHPECDFNEDELLYFIGNELGILDKIKEYDYMDEDYIDTVYHEISFNKQNMSLEEFRHYSEIKRIMTYLLNGERNNPFEDKNEKTKNKAKIIEINFRRKEDHA